MIICYWRKLRKPRNNLPLYWKYENGSSVAGHCCQPEISSVGRVPVLYTASRWFNPSISDFVRIIAVQLIVAAYQQWESIWKQVLFFIQEKI